MHPKSPVFLNCVLFLSLTFLTCPRVVQGQTVTLSSGVGGGGGMGGGGGNGGGFSSPGGYPAEPPAGNGYPGFGGQPGTDGSPGTDGGPIKLFDGGTGGNAGRGGDGGDGYLATGVDVTYNITFGTFFGGNGGLGGGGGNGGVGVPGFLHPTGAGGNGGDGGIGGDGGNGGNSLFIGYRATANIYGGIFEGGRGGNGGAGGRGIEGSPDKKNDLVGPGGSSGVAGVGGRDGQLGMAGSAGGSGQAGFGDSGSGGTGGFGGAGGNGGYSLFIDGGTLNLYGIGLQFTNAPGETSLSSVSSVPIMGFVTGALRNNVGTSYESVPLSFRLINGATIVLQNDGAAVGAPEPSSLFLLGMGIVGGVVVVKGLRVGRQQKTVLPTQT